MNKKTIRIISAILMSIILIFCINNVVMAAGGITFNEMTGTDISDKSSITSVGNKIIGALQAIGTIAAIIIIMVLGFKYMMGSAEDKADYKKSMIPYVVGAVCLFLGPQIAAAVVGFIG